MRKGTWSAALVVGLAGLAASAGADEKKKLLMLTKSVSFQHSVVENKNGKLGLAERTIKALGEKYGYDVEITKDASKINAENLKKYAGVFFYTQGDLTQKGLDKSPPMKKEDRQAILDYVKAGGAFIGTHCGGADTFNHGFWIENGKRPFNDMVGGAFIGHGPQQVAHVEVVDPKFPAVKHWDRNFSLNDEWYSYEGFQPTMHVLMILNTDGMQGGDYKRPSYPITWCSNYGKGRVFYTGLGHREDVWENANYQQMVGTGIQWALGSIEGDATPNLKDLFGDEAKALERFNTIAKREPPKQQKTKKKAGK